MEQQQERIYRLEESLHDMEIRHATLESDHRHLAPQIEKLAEEVQALRTTIDQSKGAIWVIGGFGAIAGALGHWITDLFRDHH